MGWEEAVINRWGDSGNLYASTAEVNAGVTDEKYLCPKNVDAIVSLSTGGGGGGGTTVFGDLPHITLGNTTSYLANTTKAGGGFNIEFNTHPHYNPWYFTHFTDYNNHSIKVHNDGIYKFTGLITFEINPVFTTSYSAELNYIIDGQYETEMKSIQGFTFHTDPLNMVADLDACMPLHEGDTISIEGGRIGIDALGNSVVANKTNLSICMMSSYIEDFVPDLV